MALCGQEFKDLVKRRMGNWNGAGSTNMLGPQWINFIKQLYNFHGEEIRRLINIIISLIWHPLESLAVLGMSLIDLGG